VVCKKYKDQYYTVQKFCQKIAQNVKEGSKILEVAPGPGYLSIALKKLGDYNITEFNICVGELNHAKNCPFPFI
jgi:protein-L-isoaspartate O-methyltransferase